MTNDPEDSLSVCLLQYCLNQSLKCFPEMLVGWFTALAHSDIID